MPQNCRNLDNSHKVVCIEKDALKNDDFTLTTGKYTLNGQLIVGALNNAIS